MPTLTEDDIKARIADGSVFAVTVDTAVIDGLQGQLDNAVLKRLDQFQARDIRVLFSGVVAEEVKRHIADAERESQRALNKAIRQQRNRWKVTVPDEVRDTLALRADADALAAEQFGTFLEHVHGEVVPATEMADLPAEVLRRTSPESRRSVRVTSGSTSSPTPSPS